MGELILHGDCLELMKDIPDGSIDLIMTDPPYLHIKGGNKGWVGKDYLFQGKQRFNDTFINTKMSDFDSEKIFTFLDLAKNKMKKINMVIFCSELQICHYLEWASKNKLKYNLLVWDKGNRIIMNRNRYMSNLEYIVRIYQKGVSLNSNNDNGLYCKTKTTKSDNVKIHNTQKPTSLIEGFVMLHSLEGDTILDPFAGSGTTAIACINTNRKYICMEKDETYYKLMCDRVQNHAINQNK